MSQHSDTAPKASPKPVMRYVPLILIALVALVGAYTLRDVVSFDTLRDNREALLSFRDNNTWLLVALFVAGYVAAVTFSLPGASVFSITGGFLFGLPLGTALNVTAATIGASGIFIAARMGLGDAMAARLDGSTGTMKKLRDGLRDNEWSVLFLIRLVPAVPFFVANLLPAMVGVRYSRFAITTFLGIIPGALVFTWIGVGVGEVFDRGENPDLSLLWEPHIIGPILGLCALAALPILLKSLRAGKEDPT